MRIGELAAQAGVHVQTILFYERRRLLPRAPRTSTGYRSYSGADLAQVRFIRQTQQLGFTLKEIAALLPIHGSPKNPERLSRRSASDELALFRIVSERLAQVEAQIKALQRIRDVLRTAVDQNQSRLTVCPAQTHANAQAPGPVRLSRSRHKKNA